MFSKSIIKYIQSLQHKKFRDEYNAFIAEGPKVVGELLADKTFHCKNIYATAAWADAAANTLATDHRAKISIVADFELEKLAGSASPNLVVAEFQKKEVVKIPSLKGKLTLLLDDIRDPGNFGTIIRTADWFGVAHIICSPNTVDMYNPKVVQSTMASLGRVQISYADLADEVRNHPGIPVYAAALEGMPLHKAGHVKEALLIIGNESKGIGSALLQLAEEKITIPRYGAAESLNAAIATGIILYAFTK
jgi:TrmH family RNA methyltransferase